MLVGGTTSVDPGRRRCVGETPYEQTVEILRKLAPRARPRRRSALADVVQTRIYVTDISRADEVGRAHGEFRRRTAR